MRTQKDVMLIVGAYIACALIWGTTWFAIRVCIAPGGYPVFYGAALRFTIASVVMLAFSALRRANWNLTRHQTSWIAFAGALAGVGYGLLYQSETAVTGGLAAVITATSPLLTALTAAATRTERLAIPSVVGSCIAVIGIGLIFHQQLQAPQSVIGALLLLSINPFLNAAANVCMKQHGKQGNAIGTNAVYFIAVASVLWLLTLVLAPQSLLLNASLPATFSLLYLALFGTLVAFACFFYLLRKTRLSTAMTLSFVTPIIALIVDAFLEKQGPFSLERCLGITIVLCGVGLSTLWREKKQTGQQPLNAEDAKSHAAESSAALVTGELSDELLNNVK